NVASNRAPPRSASNSSSTLRRYCSRRVANALSASSSRAVSRSSTCRGSSERGTSSASPNECAGSVDSKRTRLPAPASLSAHARAKPIQRRDPIERLAQRQLLRQNDPVERAAGAIAQERAQLVRLTRDLVDGGVARVGYVAAPQRLRHPAVLLLQIVEHVSQP